MWLFNKASSASRIALVYITAGSLIVIWTAVWRLYLHNFPPETATAYYWNGGFLATGFTLIVIGLAIGRIGREARHADMPAEVAPPPAPTNPPAPGQSAAQMPAPAPAPIAAVPHRVDPAAAVPQSRAAVAPAPVGDAAAQRNLSVPVRNVP